VPLYFETLPFWGLDLYDNNMSGQFAKSKNSSGYSSISCIANLVGKMNNFCVPLNAVGISACGTFPSCPSNVVYQETCFTPIAPIRNSLISSVLTTQSASSALATTIAPTTTLVGTLAITTASTPTASVYGQTANLYFGMNTTAIIAVAISISSFLLTASSIFMIYRRRKRKAEQAILKLRNQLNFSPHSRVMKKMDSNSLVLPPPRPKREHFTAPSGNLPEVREPFSPPSGIPNIYLELPPRPKLDKTHSDLPKIPPRLNQTSPANGSKIKREQQSSLADVPLNLPVEENGLLYGTYIKRAAPPPPPFRKGK
jgi:hypothetical protein